ncbi:unnamed protein product, partial [Brassica oleracea]
KNNCFISSWETVSIVSLFCLFVTIVKSLVSFVSSPLFKALTLFRVLRDQSSSI